MHKSTQNIVNCNLEPTLSLSLSNSLLTFLPQRVIWGCTLKSSIFLKLQESNLFPLSRTSCIHSDQATHPKEAESSSSAVLLFAIVTRWVRWRLGNPPVLFWLLINYYLVGSDQFLSIFVAWMPFTIFESSPGVQKLFHPAIPDGRTWRTRRTQERWKTSIKWLILYLWFWTPNLWYKTLYLWLEHSILQHLWRRSKKL